MWIDLTSTQAKAYNPPSCFYMHYASFFGQYFGLSFIAGILLLVVY